MRFYVPAALLGAALAMSGCANTQEVTTLPVNMTFTKQLQIQKYVTIPVWSVRYDGTKEQRVEGVPCRIVGQGFSADFQTPANLNMPVLGANTSDASVTCTYEGQQVTRILKPHNQTEERATQVGYLAGGLVGALVVAAANESRDTGANDRLTYKPFKFELNSRGN